MLSSKSFDHTKSLVQDFLKNDGRKLQTQLENIDRGSKTSWFSDFWREMYLEEREPLPINMSTANAFPNGLQHRGNPQTETAASLIAGTLNFIKNIRSARLEPDLLGGNPLCMTQYAKMFSTTRIPGIKIDKFLQFQLSSHIVVIHKHQFYKFNVFHGDGTAFKKTEIKKGLDWIVDQKAGKCADSPPIGVLTAEKRTQWAILRTMMASTAPCNRQSLDIIDKSLFVLCLDDRSPSSSEELSKILLHGDCRNRWFDKTFQLIVCTNGLSGINKEHTEVDGITSRRYIDYLFKEITSQDTTDNSQTNVKLPVLLEWKLQPAVIHGIRTAEKNADILIKRNETKILIFNKFGKKFWVDNHLSPDAIVQMGIQLAYFRLYRHFDCTYEAAQTRRFQYGRTDVIRTVSPESIEFIKSVDTDADGTKKIKLLKKAITKHRQMVEESISGHGIDRHLQALYILSKYQNNIHPVFEDQGYSKILTKSVLSTSAMKMTPGVSLVIFGPVVPNGYGLGYLVDENKIHFNITSKFRQTTDFVSLLEQSLIDIQLLVSN